MGTTLCRRIVLFGYFLSLTTPAHAATLDGHSLSIVWAIPFAGMLLSIALGPRFAAQLWDPHYGKAAFFWAALAIVPLAIVFGLQSAGEALFKIVALDYVPFVLMLFALYTAAGGIYISGRFVGTPAVNVAFLLVGALAANLIGTIGASMVLIRPVLRANASRRHIAHVMIFFIFIVGNIGGALSPLGNAPLFFGFLQGIDFFWFATHLWRQTLLLTVLVIGVFFLLDTYLFSRERKPADHDEPHAAFGISGGVNLLFIAVAIAAVTTSAIWHPGVSIDILGTRLEMQNMLREAMMLAVGFASLGLTGKGVRAANGFDWHPFFEVAALFAGIFVTIVPVMAMLEAGPAGPFAPLFALVGSTGGTPSNAAYFWVTGLLSSFLDNAPTFLVFFEVAGGDPARLMGPLADTLAAIALGASCMGAMTYIGNAPNFMIYAISRRAGVKMPGFFGFMLWSGAILAPILGILTFIFFR